MVFPSKGCTSCRSRRIKCSEEHPVCQQCVKSNRECSFNDDTGTIQFRDETAFAQGRARKPRKTNRPESDTKTPRLKLTRPKSTSCSPGADGKVQDVRVNNRHGVQCRSDPGPLCYEETLTAPLETQAFAFLACKYFDWDNSMSDSLWGYFTRHQVAYGTSNPGSALGLAMAGFAFALFGSARHYGSMVNLGQRKYFQALRKTQLVLTDEDEVLSDHTLATTLILNQMENVLLDSPDLQSVDQAFQHQQGSIVLLKLRKLRGPSLRRDVELDKQIRRQLIRHCVWRSVPVPDFLVDGSEFGESGFELELDHAIVKATNLRFEASNLAFGSDLLSKTDPISFFLRAQSILQDAQALDDELSRWVDSLPPEGLYKTHILPELLEHKEDISHASMTFDGLTYTYTSLYWAQLWGRYWGTRLLTNTMIARFSESCCLFSSIYLQSSREQVKKLADDICASVAYGLGRIGPDENGKVGIISAQFTHGHGPWSINARQAYILVYPMVIAAMSKSVPAEQRDWIKAHLKLISKVTGNRGVLIPTTAQNDKSGA